jgi:hypothetical protein
MCEGYDSDDEDQDAEAQEFNINADPGYSPYPNRIVSEL